jgi:hypothetical protein
MDSIKGLLENLKERIKAAWSEQQESELFISTKEKFEALPAVAQRGILVGILFFVILLVLWWPLSNFLDSTDFNSKFDERRQTLKELLKIERDLASQPAVPPPPSPASMKAQFDSKIVGNGVKPEQIKDQGELPPQNVSGANQQGYQYRIAHLTVRQAMDLGYDLEHTDPSFKLAGIELNAEPQDPHFYVVGLQIVNFSPKVAEAEIPGKGIVDAIKHKDKKEDSGDKPNAE